MDFRKKDNIRLLHTLNRFILVNHALNRTLLMHYVSYRPTNILQFVS